MSDAGAVWCRYEHRGRIGHGRVVGDEVIEAGGDPLACPPDTGRRQRLADVRLLAPVVPRTMYALGLNYRDHIVGRARAAGTEPQIPGELDIGYRAVNAVVGPEDAIVQPADAGPLQYEGELVAVFGRRGRDVDPADALDHVFGWTIGNDVSERGWQARDRTNWRAKNADTFKPMGPWIATDVDLEAMRTVVRVNGTEVEDFATANMLFDPATAIARLTRYCTIEPGDVMWFGTDGLSGDLGPGDRVEIELSGIGVLGNPVVAEAGRAPRG